MQSNGGICEMKYRLWEQQRSLTVNEGIFLRTSRATRGVARPVRVLFRFLVTMCCILGHSATICPSVCDCKWKDGKESVHCVNTNLTRVPERLDSSVLVLHLHGNSLLTLRNDVFQSAGLLNLQKLYLVRCAVKYIEPHAFRALKNLVELDLSYNVFSVVPSLALLPIPDLRELRLNGNPILQIAGYAFTNVGQLIRLEVADCRIGYVDEMAFNGLEHSLEWLKLSRNRLVNVRPDAFRRLEALHGLDLSENPLNCSCLLRPLRDWMLRRSLSTNALPVCQWPQHVQNRSWEKLQSDDFACLPSAQAPAKSVSAYVGENVTLMCKVGGTPPPDVRWTLRNRVLSNSTLGYPITNKRPYLIYALADSYSNLTILSLEMQDSGQYMCIAENKAGKVIAEIGLTIERAPVGPILSERVVLIGILLVTVLIVFLCSVILFIRVMYCKHDTQADIESKRRIISEKIEMKRNSANLKRSSSVVPNAKAENNPSSKKLTDSLFNRHNDELDFEAGSKLDESEAQKPLRPKDFKEIKSKPNVVEQKSPSSSIFESHIGEITLQHHVLHKKKLPSGKLYTTAMAFMTDDTMMNYEAAGMENSTYAKKKSHYNTMPKNPSSNSRVRRNMSGYPRVSESQSPLLRDKYYGSSSESVQSNLERVSARTDYPAQAGNSYPKSVRRSKDGYWAYPSLPSSPDKDRYWTYSGPASGGHNPSGTKETPLLNSFSARKSKNHSSHVNYAAYSPPSHSQQAAATGSSIEQSLASTTYDYHAAQLERFLDEYRRLHSELTKMKETCERFGGSRAGSVLDLNGTGLLDNLGSAVGLAATPAGSAGLRYPSLKGRLHRRSKSSLSERAFDSRGGSLHRSLSAKSQRSFERPLQSKSCSFERSVSFVPTAATASGAAALLKDSAGKATTASADDVVVPKSILKKKSDADCLYGGARVGYERRAYGRPVPYMSSTLPLKRTRVRRFSDSSMEGFFD